MFKLIIIVIILLALAFAGFAVKMFFKKGGEFKKHCASIDPKTGKPLSCVCGGEEEEGTTCENRLKREIKPLDITD